jgi:hypothetical protein
MLKKLYQGIARLVSKPFRKPQPPVVEWQPISPQQRPESRLRSQMPSQGVSSYSNGTSQGMIVRPLIPTIEPWEDLLPAGGPHATHDLIWLVVGSALQLLTQAHDFITEQNPDQNRTALLLGMTCTPGDEEALGHRALQQPYWERQAARTKTGYAYVDNVPTHRIFSKLLVNLTANGGNAADQKQALLTMQTDPFIVPKLLEIMEKACRSYLDYAGEGCALFTVQAGGGTDPMHRLAEARLIFELPVNRLYKLLLLPTDDEPLLIPNMKATLAYELEHEASEKIPTLRLLKQQKTIGPHDDDRALVSGVITLTGASRSRLNGVLDPTNKYRLIRKTAGSWLTVHPLVVPLPLKSMGTVELRDGQWHEDPYLVLLDEELGGKRFTPILRAIYNFLAEDPSAPHFITVASSLRQDEIAAIASGAKRFPLQPGGQVHVFCNPCYPTVPPGNDVAEALLCDFRGGTGVKKCLHKFLLHKQGTSFSNGFSLADRLDLAGKVPERFLTEAIEKDILRLLKSANLE